MWRMQLNCSRLQPCPDHRRLQQLQEHPLQTYRRQMQTHRRKRLQSQSLIILIVYDFNSFINQNLILQQYFLSFKSNNYIINIVHHLSYLQKYNFMMLKLSFLFSVVKSFGVVGSGQMGTGIAIVANKVAKLPVTIYDSNPVSLQKSKNFVTSWLKKEQDKNRITAQQISLFNSRMSFIEDINFFNEKNVDFVVEAIVQNLNVKQSVLSALDKILKPQAIIASNTSSISITQLASATKRPAQVIGMHFMNPVPVMKLVEVIRALQTSDSTHKVTEDLATQMGKQISTSKDIPGFIANRLLMPYINQAIYALYEGIGTKEDIDKTMKLGTNVPMGPLTLADFIGLDTCLSIMNVLHRDLGDSKYRACPLLVNYVHAGYLGVKSGKGFYDYKQKK